MASIVVRVSSCSLLTLALLTAACSDDGAAGDGTEQSTGTASTTPTPSTTGSSTTDSTPDPSTGTASTGTPELTSSSSSGTEGVDTGTESTEGTTEGTTGSTGETTGTTGTTGNQGNVVYSAIAIPGGLDRVRVFKADLDNDRCTWVTLVTPDIPGLYPGMTIPAGWSVEAISINDVAAACSSDNPAMFGSEPATDANGTIGFGMLGGTGIYPCTVDIDATFDFAGILPGIPPTDDMIATDVPVTGC